MILPDNPTEDEMRAYLKSLTYSPFTPDDGAEFARQLAHAILQQEILHSRTITLNTGYAPAAKFSRGSATPSISKP